MPEQIFDPEEQKEQEKHKTYYETYGVLYCHKRTCQCCHNPFYCNYSARRYCSYHCTKEANKTRRRQRAEQKRDKICQICNTPFTAGRNDTKYCSVACKQKAYRKSVTDKVYFTSKVACNGNVTDTGKGIIYLTDKSNVHLKNKLAQSMLLTILKNKKDFNELIPNSSIKIEGEFVRREIWKLRDKTKNTQLKSLIKKGLIKCWYATTWTMDKYCNTTNFEKKYIETTDMYDARLIQLTPKGEEVAKILLEQQTKKEGDAE